MRDYELPSASTPTMDGNHALSFRRSTVNDTREPLAAPQALLLDALRHPPAGAFPWQSRLLADWMRGTHHGVLDLPTGLGKTSVMAIWLVAKACGALTLGRRLVYVVDRRAVVDQATTEAMRLRAWVSSRPAVRTALGLDDAQALPISTLRGQFLDNRDWLECPTLPAIIVGTVDMIGSRLLFEGYGCSRKMRPYHAGLLGCDSLLVLDEAHLVPPFEHLLEQVEGADALWPPEAVDAGCIPRPRLLSLSATGRSSRAEPFRLDEADRLHPIVKQRTSATKRILWEPLDAKAQLSDALAQRAWDLAQRSSEPTRVVVFASRRDDAEHAKTALETLAARSSADASEVATELLVGARRLHERARAERRLRDELGFIADSPRPARHTFLFATSAGEVGIDLDADHMVADAVAWERMVQRLGRVNRRGARAAEIAVLAQEDSRWTQPLTPLMAELPALEAGGRDGSPDALTALRDRRRDLVDAASTPEPLYPALSRPLVEAWAMTSLPTHTGRPDVAPWLRGWPDDDESDPFETTVVWRHFLPPREATTAERAAFFEAAPPQMSEGLTTETHRGVDWLLACARRVAKRLPNDASEREDVVALAIDAAGGLKLDADKSPRQWTLNALARPYTARDKEFLHRALRECRLVIGASLGGLSADGLLDSDADAAPVTGDTGAPQWKEDGAPLPFVVSLRNADDDCPLALLQIAETRGAEDEVSRWLVVERTRESPNEESRSVARRAQRLEEHQAWTAENAKRIVAALKLPPTIGAAITAAARLHDEGKQAPRWQKAFSAPPDDVYAKTRGPFWRNVLEGYRHEMGSLPFAQKDAELRSLTPDMQALALHLIAAHHGFARPSISVEGCDDAPPSAVEARAREVALRYVALQRRFGPWGLAWLETLVRAADQQASRANDETKGNA
jgi:CRISPR-associated endonuclease/helicase Cas3